MDLAWCVLDKATLCSLPLWTDLLGVSRFWGQLRWLGPLYGMSHVCLPQELLQAWTWEETLVRLRTCCSGYVTWLGTPWDSQKQLVEVSGVKEVWLSLLRLKRLRWRDDKSPEVPVQNVINHKDGLVFSYAGGGPGSISYSSLLHTTFCILKDFM